MKKEGLLCFVHLHIKKTEGNIVSSQNPVLILH